MLDFSLLGLRWVEESVDAMYGYVCREFSTLERCTFTISLIIGIFLIITICANYEVKVFSDRLNV